MFTPEQLAEYDAWVRQCEAAGDNPEGDYCPIADYFSGADWLAGAGAN